MHSSAKSMRRFLHAGNAQTLAFQRLGRRTNEVAPVIFIADGRSLETGKNGRRVWVSAEVPSAANSYITAS